jgi:hypothetical protein
MPLEPGRGGRQSPSGLLQRRAVSSSGNGMAWLSASQDPDRFGVHVPTVSMKLTAEPGSLLPLGGKQQAGRAGQPAAAMMRLQQPLQDGRAPAPGSDGYVGSADTTPVVPPARAPGCNVSAVGGSVTRAQAAPRPSLNLDFWPAPRPRVEATKLRFRSLRDCSSRPRAWGRR